MRIYFFLFVTLLSSEHFSLANTLLSDSQRVEHLVRQHVALERQKRYLLYPDGDPARVQLIIGLGLPVSLEDESVTIGYVVKILYHVPQEPEDYSTHMFNSASLVRAFSGQNTVVVEGNHTKETIAKIYNNKPQQDTQKKNGNEIKELNDIDNKRGNEEIYVNDTANDNAEDDELKDTNAISKENFTTKYRCKNINDENKHNDNTNESIKCHDYLETAETDEDYFNKDKLKKEPSNNINNEMKDEMRDEMDDVEKRKKRDVEREKNANFSNKNKVDHLNRVVMYSKGESETITDKDNNDDGHKIMVTLGDEGRAAENNSPHKDELINVPKTTRWDIYKIFENMMEQKGYEGRSCMLRTICESSETPFTHKNGVLGELVHILLTPSATREILSHPTDKDYHTAEARGKMEDVVCQEMYPDCEESLLELFSEFVIGVGFPLDLDEEVVNIGYVLRIAYPMPTNVSDFIDSIFRQDRRIFSRRREFRNDAKRATRNRRAESEEDNYRRNIKKQIKGDILNEIMNEEISEVNNDVMKKVTNEGDIKINISESSKEEDKAKAFDNFDPDYKDLKVENDGTERSKDWTVKTDDCNVESEKMDSPEVAHVNKLSRWELYELMEMFLDRKGFPGRACLLRTICEASNIPFTHGAGLLGEMMHVIFTPSSTNEELFNHSDNEYIAAEILGSETLAQCGRYFHECETSLLDLISKVYL